MSKIQLLSPVGRIVMGSLYEPYTKDADGNPLVVKTGPSAGQPRVQFFFALAVPKQPGHTHWSQTEWGAKIWSLGHQAFPQAAQSPTFAWKIEDGDSQIPNKKGNKPCDNEGFKGNWIIKFGGGYAPKVYEQKGNDCLLNVVKDFVKPGYFAEVQFSVDSNDSTAQPGIYINHNMVCFRGFGQEIVFGPDPNSVGFGQAALPAGASAVPLATTAPLPAPAAPIHTMLPAANGASYESLIAAGWTDALLVQHGMMAGSVQTPPTAAPVPVIPNVAFVQVPPPVPVRTMLPAANGASYDSLIAAGWTDALLVKHGMMTA